MRCPARRDLEICARTACWWLEDNPLAAARVRRADLSGACGPTTTTTWSTSVVSIAFRGRAAGGLGARAGHAVRESWCWPRSRPRTAHPRSPTNRQPLTVTHDWRPDQLYRETSETPGRHAVRMEQHLPPGVPTGPRRTAGFYFWLTVRKAWTPKVDAAEGRHPAVAYASGTGFTPTGSAAGSCACRSLPPPERIREGVRRWPNVLPKMELFRTFGSVGSPVGFRPQSPSPHTADRYGCALRSAVRPDRAARSRHVPNLGRVLSGGSRHERRGVPAVRSAGLSAALRSAG